MDRTLNLSYLTLRNWVQCTVIAKCRRFNVLQNYNETLQIIFARQIQHSHPMHSSLTSNKIWSSTPYLGSSQVIDLRLAYFERSFYVSESWLASKSKERLVLFLDCGCCVWRYHIRTFKSSMRFMKIA